MRDRCLATFGPLKIDVDRVFIKLSEYFDPEIHCLEKQCEVDGELLCTDIFETLFTIDEEVKVGDTRSIE
jgi:hypothetical protein